MLKRFPHNFLKSQASRKLRIGSGVHSVSRSLFYSSVRNIHHTSTAGSAAAANGESTSNMQGFLQTSDNSELKNTFYQRKLPEQLIKISSPQGKQLFREAMDAGQTEGFFPLTGAFASQSSPSYCGPSSRNVDLICECWHFYTLCLLIARQWLLFSMRWMWIPKKFGKVPGDGTLVCVTSAGLFLYFFNF